MNSKIKLAKRILSSALAAALVLTTLPATALAADDVIQVGGADGESWAEAIKAANAATSNVTLQLGGEVTVSDETTLSNSNAKITLDLNGKELILENKLTLSAGDVTITDSGDEGIIYETAAASFISVTKGSLTLNGGTIAADNDSENSDALLMVEGENAAVTMNSGAALSSKTGSTLKISSGSLIVNGGKMSSSQQYNLYIDGGTIVINDGTFAGGEIGAYVTGSMKDDTDGSVTINGGTFQGESCGFGSGNYASEESSAQTVLKGGTYQSKKNSDAFTGCPIMINYKTSYYFCRVADGYTASEVSGPDSDGWYTVTVTESSTDPSTPGGGLIRTRR